LHREFPELQSVWFVDSFPIPEAELAVQTGLGWRGKNTLVLHQKAGSAFHLGGLLLSLEGIEPSDPVANFCGKCTACLDACPTGALLDNGLLDAGKCLSHWNLEDRSVTEGVAAEAARSEILGCDICQQVCPWNHKLMQELPLPERWPQSWEDWIRLCLPQGGFQSLFKRTPLDRPGRARILKVLLRALYNVDKERLRAIAPEVLERETRPEIRAWLEQCGVLPSSGA
jgi:epoxyqueuosine reductase